MYIYEPRWTELNLCSITQSDPWGTCSNITLWCTATWPGGEGHFEVEGFMRSSCVQRSDSTEVRDVPVFGTALLRWLSPLLRFHGCFCHTTKHRQCVHITIYIYLNTYIYIYIYGAWWKRQWKDRMNHALFVHFGSSRLSSDLLSRRLQATVVPTAACLWNRARSQAECIFGDEHL